MRRNNLSIREVAKQVGCCHMVIVRVRENLPIIGRIALKVTELTNGEVIPKVVERGRKKGSKVKNAIKHGMSRKREYHIWCRIRRCCYQEKFCQFKSYGALGITICTEWDD